jgi:4-amino-4-deoxy-L-arabinose transferase-like glycosyltransferase
MYLGVILVLGCILRVIIITESSLTDDAYITFRYARNLASGYGFVYNIGERVLGTTTPVYAILLVPFIKLGFSPDAISITLAVICDLLICVLLYLLFQKSLGDCIALLTSLFYATAYVSIAACGYGMETQLFILFVVASVLFLEYQRYMLMAAVAGLAVVTRPEGALLAVIFAVALFIKLRRDDLSLALRTVLLFIAVAAPWYIFAMFYFGSPFPNSMLAKYFQRSITVHEWLDFFVMRNHVIVMYWLGTFAGLLYGIRIKSRAIILLVAWAVVYTLFFLIGRPPFLGGWYFPPVMLSIATLAAVGFAKIGGWVLRGTARAVVVLAVFMVLLIAVILPKNLENTVRWYRKTAGNVYIPVAEWVAENTKPNDIIHASDIGYLGYISGRRILDAAALVTPQIRIFNAKHREDPNWDVLFVLESMPDYVVLPIEYGVYRRFSNSAFAQHYEPVIRYQVEGEDELYPSDEYLLKKRRERRFIADFIIYKKALNITG